MWTERPRPFIDGLGLTTIVGLVTCLIVSIVSAHDVRPDPSGCQEVIVAVHPKQGVLARCPTGTYLEILDENVICRCSRPPSFVMPLDEDNDEDEPTPSEDRGKQWL